MDKNTSQRKHRAKKPATHKSYAFKRERNLKDIDLSPSGKFVKDVEYEPTSKDIKRIAGNANKSSKLRAIIKALADR